MANRPRREEQVLAWLAVGCFSAILIILSLEALFS